MSETYGFSKVSSRVLKSDLTPDTTKKILINGYIGLETGKYDASKENYTSDDNSKDSIGIKNAKIG